MHDAIGRTLDDIRTWGYDREIIGVKATTSPAHPIRGQMLKLMEEVGELATALQKNDIADIMDAVGDTVVVLTLLSELCGFTLEEAVGDAYTTISTRTGTMQDGVFVKDCHCTGDGCTMKEIGIGGSE